MSDKTSKPDSGGDSVRHVELSEGAKAGLIMPIQTAPLDITNQVSGPPAPASPPAQAPPSPPSGSSQE